MTKVYYHLSDCALKIYVLCTIEFRSSFQAAASRVARTRVEMSSHHAKEERFTVLEINDEVVKEKTTIFIKDQIQRITNVEINFTEIITASKENVD